MLLITMLKILVNFYCVLKLYTIWCLLNIKILTDASKKVAGLTVLHEIESRVFFLIKFASMK